MSAVTIVAIVAGAAGALIRHLVSRGFSRRGSFPWPVFIVNVVGSALAGAVLGFAQVGAVSSDMRLILVTGFCGGLTTFSTLSVETVQLVFDGKTRVAALSITTNLVLGIVAAATAYVLIAASAL